MQFILILAVAGFIGWLLVRRRGSGSWEDLTEDQKAAVGALKDTNGNLTKAGKKLGTSPQAVRSRADKAARKLGEDDLYDKNTM